MGSGGGRGPPALTGPGGGGSRRGRGPVGSGVRSSCPAAGLGGARRGSAGLSSALCGRARCRKSAGPVPARRVALATRARSGPRPPCLPRCREGAVGSPQAVSATGAPPEIVPEGFHGKSLKAGGGDQRRPPPGRSLAPWRRVLGHRPPSPSPVEGSRPNSTHTEPNLWKTDIFLSKKTLLAILAPSKWLEVCPPNPPVRHLAPWRASFQPR